MTAVTKPVLSDELRQALAIAGVEIRKGHLRPELLDQIITLLDRMPPADAARADSQIAFAAGMFMEPILITPRTPLFAIFGKKPVQMPDMPGIEHIMVFHFSGYKREEALERFRGGLRSPFFFAAVAYRLNDWVPEVREAARACADRVFPLTDPTIVAEAAIALLPKRRAWRRWNGEAQVLDKALLRSDVLTCLVQRIRESNTGPMATVLRELLRWQNIDDRLPELASESVQPVLRAIALQALIDGKTKWRTGYRREWIDKPYGIFRSVPVYTERQLAIDRSRAHFLEMAARDRSAAVRRIAAAALIKYGASIENRSDLAERLVRDPSPSIRARMDFLRKHLED